MARDRLAVGQCSPVTLRRRGVQTPDDGVFDNRDVTHRLAQREDGSFGAWVHAEDGAVTVTALAATALTCAGVAEDDPDVARAWAFVRRFGGLEAVGQALRERGTTLLAFAVMPIRCARRMGADVPAADAADHHAPWRALAPALGVHEDLVPADYGDGDTVLDALIEANAAPSDAGRVLAAALIDGIARHLAIPGPAEAAAWFVRYLVGERLASMLEIPDVDASARRKWSRLASAPAVKKLAPLLGRDLRRLIVKQKLTGVTARR